MTYFVVVICLCGLACWWYLTAFTVIPFVLSRFNAHCLPFVLFFFQSYDVPIRVSWWIVKPTL
jgi:hypothetical protein